ncbi:MAG: NAD(P)-dependent oxidoreductase, partial [Halofilum sp. (in: g-proteobacteria)]
VAELAFGLLLAIDRNIPDNVIALRSGQWDKKQYSKADGIMGRHIGIVGMGGIGVALAQRAQAFGMHIHFVEPKLSKEAEQAVAQLGAKQHSAVNEMARECDVLSFHVPATPETTGIIGDALLAECQPGTIILNTARGELVDDDALIRAMDEKGIRAGLDVYNGEPGGGQGEFDSKLAKHPNVYGTHHIGASTEQAQNAIAAEVVRMLDEFGKGNVLHCVNL